MVKAKDNFKEVITRKGFSLRGLSIEAGLSPTTVQQAYKRSIMYPSTAKKICDALECKFDELFEIVESKKAV